MENFVIQAVYQELNEALPGRVLGKVYQLGASELALDFRLRDGQWLLISTRPDDPRIYLSQQSIKQLEREATGSQFSMVLRKHLSGAALAAIYKPATERSIRFAFESYNAAGESVDLFLLCDLTGRSSNLYLLDQEHRIIDQLRYKKGQNPAAVLGTKLDSSVSDKTSDQMTDDELTQLLESHDLPLIQSIRQSFPGFGPLLAKEVAFRIESDTRHLQDTDKVIAAVRAVATDVWRKPPQPIIYSTAPLSENLANIDAKHNLVLSSIELQHLASKHANRFTAISQAADAYYGAIKLATDLTAEIGAIRAKWKTRLERYERLVENLRTDLGNLGDENQYRRFAELLLANLATLERNGEFARVIDLYDPDQTMIDIPLDVGQTPQAGAEGYFKLYQRARRGREEIGKRLEAIDRELNRLHQAIERLDEVKTTEDLRHLKGQLEATPKTKKPRATADPNDKRVSGVRRFVSSDNYEILIGRSSSDNDNLTFKLGRPADLWLHAADYPGSHVIVRNPRRDPIPHRTIIEAAQLAAHFSQAKNEGKAVVNYTERKFVHKPKGAAPGLVRLASFKSIAVKPEAPAKELEQ